MTNKLAIHKAYAFFLADFKLDYYILKEDSVGVDTKLGAIADLEEFQEKLLTFVAWLFTTPGFNLNQLIASALIPMITESYNVYNMLVHMLTSAVKSILLYLSF